MKKIIKNFLIFSLLSFTLLNINKCSSYESDIENENEEELSIQDSQDQKYDLEDKAQDYPYKSNYKKSKVQDDDEFDNPDLLTEKKKKQKKQKINSKENAMDNIEEEILEQAKLHKEEEERSLNLTLYEYCMTLFVVIFIISCYFGKTSNEYFAMKWFKANKSFYTYNYAHIGHENSYSNFNLNSPFLVDSYSNFKFYASGRVNLNYMLVNIELKKRQDLISSFSSLILSTEKDKIIYETSLCPADNIPMVFALCKKKDRKTLMKTYSDIDFFTNNYTNPAMQNEGVIILTENKEVFDESIFGNKEFRRLYNKVEDFIDIIFFTDRQTFSKDKYSIFFSFDFDTSSKKLEEDFSNINEFVHIFIDILCTQLRFSNAVNNFFIFSK